MGMADRAYTSDVVISDLLHMMCRGVLRMAFTYFAIVRFENIFLADMLALDTFDNIGERPSTATYSSCW